jgi:hypothetical protein
MASHPIGNPKDSSHFFAARFGQPASFLGQLNAGIEEVCPNGAETPGKGPKDDKISPPFCRTRELGDVLNIGTATLYDRGMRGSKAADDPGP